MQAIEGHQRTHVSLGVTASERLGRRPAPIHDASTALPLRDQACQLRWRVPGDLERKGTHEALVGATEGAVVKLAQRGSQPRMAVGLRWRREPHFGIAVEEGTHVGQGG